jgi:acetyl-CoA carboxylase carboxyl transferase subunit alpha
MRVTAPDLLELGIVDEVVPEPLGGAHRNWNAAAKELKASLERHLGELTRLSAGDLLDRRWEKLRGLGAYAAELAALG